MNVRLSVVLWLFAAQMLGVLAGCATLQTSEQAPQQQPIRLLDRIWLQTPPLKSALSAQGQKYAEATLTQWLETYLHQQYEITDRKFFWVEQDSTEWAKLRANYINRMKTEWSGRLVVPSWQEPGYDLLPVWRVEVDGTAHYFTMAMTDQSIPRMRGRQLVGHFQLRKLDGEDQELERIDVCCQRKK